MTIALLGWGSLVWDARDLPIQRYWFDDGPMCSVEFTRQSNDGRITLVIDPDSTPVRTLWAAMITTSLTQAREQLRDREGLTGSNWAANVGCWRQGEDSPRAIARLEEWSAARGVGAVIWTALGPKFNGAQSRPSWEQVVDYLRGLEGPTRDNAEKYVRFAPRQIDTAYRRRIEASFGWTARDPDV